MFAAGHLGELTRLVPFEMVDDVLALTRRAQSRIRLLPARVVVYLVLASVLFGDVGYRQVWSRLVSGLPAPRVSPSASALRQARQRLGPAPLRALFDLLRGPAATTAGQTRWRGMLLTVLDGTLLVVADSPANAARYTKQRLLTGGCSGYPQLRLSALLTCGTRSVIDAVFNPVSVGELDQARALARSLRPGMLLLADRNYAGADLLTTLAATGADLLIRCKNGRRLPILRRHHDGSWLSRIGALTIRVIEAQISITTAAGTRTGDYRLLTTLLDPHHHPSAELVRLYHERWEIETAYLELKSSILGGRVLR